MQSIHDHAMLPQRPATGLAENASLYLYSDYQEKLRELAARLAGLDAGLQSHLLPRCGSKRKWCLALAFSTPYLASLYEGGAGAAAGEGCPAALLREDATSATLASARPAIKDATMSMLDDRAGRAGGPPCGIAP